MPYCCLVSALHSSRTFINGSNCQSDRTMLGTKIKLTLARIAVWYVGFLLLIWPIALFANFVMSTAGVSGVVADTVREVVFGGIYLLIVAAIWPPWYSDADIAARNEDFEPYARGSATTDEAVAAIESLNGVAPGNPAGVALLIRPIIKRDNTRRIAGAVFKATSTPRKRRAVVEKLDIGIEEILIRLFGLADHGGRKLNLIELIRPRRSESLGHMPYLMTAIERLARDDPAALKPHRDALVETLSSDDDRAAGHAALALGHLGREFPDAIEDYVERIVPLVEHPEPSRQRPAALALAELAAHSPVAVAALGDLVDTADPALQGLLADADAHYAQSDAPREDPYPGWEHLDNMERNHQAHDREGAFREALTGTESADNGDGFNTLLGTYECENCGTTLEDHWDLSGGSDFACGNCGYELENQFGAIDTYWSEHWLEE